ncbi:PepSY domain-containing protein [Methyloceanibacter superfactus]|jgi:uncharacterized membrane protein YkoI|nr:hypothetical protein [Methyloceanibacter superfactus]
MMCWAMKRTAIAALAAVMLTAAWAPAQAGCVPWKSAGAIISQNSLVPGNVIYNKVQSKTGGKVISATLCESGGKFVYKIVVLGKKGDVTNLTVDARTGQF